MFADDTKLWNTIGTESDSSTLQANINRLGDWSQKWLLTFNPGKCKVMHVGHALQTKYYMNDGGTTTELAPVAAEKDLGVDFTRDLKSSTQCRNSAARVRRIIGMVHRHFRRLGKQDFLLTYKSYIHPHLEYSIQAWSPHLRKDIDTLETVQKAATGRREVAGVLRRRVDPRADRESAGRPPVWSAETPVDYPQ